MTRETTRVLRSRLLIAAGLGAFASFAAPACSGETTSKHGDAGSMGGAAGATSADASASGGAATGGASTGGSGGASGGGTGGAAGSGIGGTCTPYPQCVTVRRPFLVGADLRSSSVAERADWMDVVSAVEVPHARTAEFLAEAWLRDALEEHASVAAFARFTLLLLSVGAPPELVILSQRASLDEIQHARACFALAHRYGSRSVGPASLQVADSLTPMSLADVVALTVTEGCVGETLGALLATEQLAHATDPGVRRVLGRIARDEARHAELAWKFLAWALEQGQTAVQAAAERAFAAASEEIRRMPVVDYGVDREQWHAHGRVTCAEAREISAAGLDEVVQPCLAALIAKSTGQLRAAS